MRLSKIKFYFLYSSVILIIINSTINKTNRPDEDKRKFSSKAVEEILKENKNKIKDKVLSYIYENCFPNTLDTTVNFDEEKSDTFIITGDIEAMWLRDSSFQVFPYISLANKDENLRKMFYNLLLRQSKSILIDPYANAFNKDEFESPWQSDETYKLVDGKRVKAMNTKIWERKWELDSLISTLFLTVNYIKATNDYAIFSNETSWIESLDLILSVIKKEMHGTDEEDLLGGPEYFFQRKTYEPFDSLHQGRGNPVASCGLVKSMFRNSDDSSLFSYSIPENAFLSATFRKLSDILRDYLEFYLKSNKNLRMQFGLLNNVYKKDFLRFDSEMSNLEKKEKNKLNENYFVSDFKINDKHYQRIKKIVKSLKKISEKVEENIYRFGVFKDQETGEKYFAYEVDCFGNHYFIDDPGYPSLISMPFFGFLDSNNEIYLNTRKRILSNKNPYFIKGKLGEGLSSAHAPRRNLWPLFTIMRGITSNDENEIRGCIELLKKTAEKTGFIHESVNIDNPDEYTRSWFAWANSFFGYFINNVIEKYPKLLE